MQSTIVHNVQKFARLYSDLLDNSDSQESTKIAAFLFGKTAIAVYP